MNLHQNEATNQDLAERNQALQQQVSQLEMQLFAYKQELDFLKRQLFGRKSERFIAEDNGQMHLDLEAEVWPVAVEQESIKYTRKKPEKDKKRPVRLILPAHLSREEEIYEPETVEGARKIGELITEILEYDPGKLYVRRIIRPKYVLPAEQGITVATLPNLLIEKGNLGAGLAAHLLVSKFVDHMPFYRIVQQFKRQGVEIAESTINGWFNAVCELLEPLYEALKQEVQQADYLMADETPIKVLDSQKKGDTHKGYHWVYYAPLQKMVCFDYRKGRGRAGPKEFLTDFTGTIQTDGYKAYDVFEDSEQITLLACLAHARRYFEKAQDQDAARASYVLERMQQLYTIERQAREADLSADERKELRQKEAIPILDQLQEWMIENYSHVLPRSAIGKAIAYSLGLWKRLCRYTEDGRYEIDNNWVENSIRPVALGRKNYLFAGSHNGAQKAAMIYSLLGTCKKHGVEPFLWLKTVLEKIGDYPINQISDLLPARLKL